MTWYVQNNVNELSLVTVRLTKWWLNYYYGYWLIMMHFREQRHCFNSVDVNVACRCVAVSSLLHPTLPDGAPMPRLSATGRRRLSGTTVEPLHGLLSYCNATNVGKHCVSTLLLHVMAWIKIFEVFFALPKIKVFFDLVLDNRKSIWPVKIPL